MPSRCAGVVATACTQGKRTQHGKPHGVVSNDQPEAREGQAGRLGVAERFVSVRWAAHESGGLVQIAVLRENWRSLWVNRARALVLGASGLNGGALVALLDKMGTVEVVRGARDPRTVASWKDEGKAAVRIDLDDPLSFPAAPDGVDRLFLMTGYTIHMVHQMKTITDTAVDAGVSYQSAFTILTP
jgi:hypothetical protein